MEIPHDNVDVPAWVSRDALRVLASNAGEPRSAGIPVPIELPDAAGFVVYHVNVRAHVRRDGDGTLELKLVSFVPRRRVVATRTPCIGSPPGMTASTAAPSGQEASSTRPAARAPRRPGVLRGSADRQQ